MADWSQLPKELLLLIAECLEICFDITHFRSVCSSWRSSVPPKPCPLPARCQLTPFDCKIITSFCLSKRIIVLIRLPKNHNQAAQDSWLVKIDEHNYKFKQMHLLNPLSNSRINKSMVFCSSFFDSVLLNSLNYQVIELSQEYVLHYETFRDHTLEPQYKNYTSKVALMWSSTEKNDYVLLVVHYYGKLAMLRCGDKQWTILENMPQYSCADIISFNGKFYAVDKEGRTMVVEPSSNMSFFADVGSRTGKKFLVESGGQLLLVEMLLVSSSERNMGFGTGNSMQQGRRSPMRMVWFKVYKLNEAGQKWDNVKSLGDRVLFLGEHGSFSASASEFPWSKGNYIFFGIKNFKWDYESDRDLSNTDMYVFNYENGSVTSLTNCPGFSKLFCPPPDWVTITTRPVLRSFSSDSDKSFSQ